MLSTKAPLLVCLLGLTVEVYLLGFDYTAHVEAKGAHQVLLKEFGAGIPLTQTFGMQNNGLKGIRIRLAAREPSDVTLDWRISEQRSPEASTVIEKREQPYRVSGETWVELLFPAIPQSSGKVYRLESRAAAPTSTAVAIAASLDDALPGGEFEVGGEERWGDLVMDTIATGDTIRGRVLAAASMSDGRLRGLLLPAFALGLYNVLLAAFVVHFWPRARAALPVAEPAAARWPTRRIAVVVCVCVIVAAAAVFANHRRRPAIDLMDELHTAELHAPSMKIHLAFVLTDVVVGGAFMRAIAAHPQSEIAWTVTIPARARLRTAIATVPSVWSLPGDGVVFRIGVSENGAYSELFARHLDPARVPADRRWVPVDLDLSRFAGHQIRLIFKTDPSLPDRPADPTYDWARWGAPRLVTN